MIYITLYLEFVKIGLFAVGGGLASLPFIQQLSDKYGWITQEQLLDMIAISESTPGPIGVNIATYVGNITAGIPGGIVATIGIVTPSIIIIIIIAHYFAKFSEKPIVRSAFYGIRPAVAGLIAAVGFQIAKVALFNMEKYINTNNIIDALNISGVLLFTIMLYLINKYKKHPIVYIVAAAFIGIIFKL